MGSNGTSDLVTETDLNTLNTGKINHDKDSIKDISKGSILQSDGKPKEKIQSNKNSMLIDDHINIINETAEENANEN